MLKKILSLILSTSLMYTAFSIPVIASTSTVSSIEWQKTFGNTEYLCHTEQTSDGGYISCGQYSNLMYITKLDSSGNTEWEQRPFDIPSTSNCIKQTSDGGYIICGNARSENNSTRYGHLVKLDCNGNIEWDTTLSDTRVLNDVIQDNDGNYVTVGVSHNSYQKGDIYVEKVDQNGNTITGYYYGGSELEEGEKIRQTPDGGYIIVGCTFTYVTADGLCGIYLIKTNNDLSQSWSRTTNLGNYSSDYNPYDLECTNDGGYVIAGNRKSKYGFLIKVNSSGFQEFEKAYGSDIFDVAQLDNGNFILVGDENVGNTYNYHTYVVNTDSTGKKLSSYTPEFSKYSISKHVSLTNDDGFILTNTLSVGGTCQLMKFGNIE